jgi:[glutamine synthetase] adenylyltransferase / [glutamine synthetase]-adenylyl-L-tyrosine phosphorylase
MPALPEISSYNKDDISAAEKKSPALTHYLNLLKISNDESFSAQLRLKRHRAWSRCALATLLDRSPPLDICAYWSEQTDLIVREAWQHVGAGDERLALFALGKWGAEELNLSSDIDVVFISEDAPTAEQTRKLRELLRVLGEVTDHGFVCRVDTDLKPGGRMSPLVSSLKQFEDYYWSTGATWERLALVRLRPICGPAEIQEQITKTAQKYSYRKFLDYSLLEDLKHLRSQIHEHYPEKEMTARNVKLSPGGIRDLELFIHALQIIHGGKEVALRTNSTVIAAKKLREAKRFDTDDLDFLLESYGLFRQIENKIQAREDQQTHVLNQKDAPEDFAVFLERSAKVGTIVEQILGKPSQFPTLPLSLEAQTEWLKELGFSTRSLEQYWPQLSVAASSGAKSYIDEELRGRVLRQFIEAIHKYAVDKDLALALLNDFFRAIRVKSSFLSLLAHEERLIKELSIVMGCSPYLGGVISHRPELLDSLLFRTSTIESASFDSLLDLLAERRLIAETISANQFLQNLNLELLNQNLSVTADDICLTLMRRLAGELGISPIQILALGKWGGRELGFRSDLDFVFVTDAAPTETEQRLARRFVSRLTEQHRGGAIYAVDLRLRPSGRAGPVLVTKSQLLNYLSTTAEVWERQSYLRARHLEDANFSKEVHLCASKRGLSEHEIASLADIREQLLKKETAPDAVDLKYSHGGLIDIEFFVQIYFLNRTLPAPSPNSFEMLQWIETNDRALAIDASRLIQQMRELRVTEQLLQLFDEHSTSLFQASADGALRIAAFLDISVDSKFKNLKNTLAQSDSLLKTIDPRHTKK